MQPCRWRQPVASSSVHRRSIRVRWRRRIMEVPHVGGCAVRVGSHTTILGGEQTTEGMPIRRRQGTLSARVGGTAGIRPSQKAPWVCAGNLPKEICPRTSIRQRKTRPRCRNSTPSVCIPRGIAAGAEGKKEPAREERSERPMRKGSAGGREEYRPPGGSSWGWGRADAARGRVAQGQPGPGDLPHAVGTGGRVAQRVHRRRPDGDRRCRDCQHPRRRPRRAAAGRGAADRRPLVAAAGASGHRPARGQDEPDRQSSRVSWVDPPADRRRGRRPVRNECPAIPSLQRVALSYSGFHGPRPCRSISSGRPADPSDQRFSPLPWSFFPHPVADRAGRAVWSGVVDPAGSAREAATARTVPPRSGKRRPGSAIGQGPTCDLRLHSIPSVDVGGGVGTTSGEGPRGLAACRGAQRSCHSSASPMPSRSPAIA